MDSRGIPVRITQSNGEKRVIGYVRGEVFTSFRTESKHLYRGGNHSLKYGRENGLSAWGLDCAVVEGLLKRGVKKFVIKTRKATYVTDLALMKEKGFVVHHKPHRPQYFLNERYFSKE